VQAWEPSNCWNYLKSHSGGLLGSLGRFHSFTSCHSLDAWFRYFCVHYGGWGAVACCLSSWSREACRSYMFIATLRKDWFRQKNLKVEGAESKRRPQYIILVIAPSGSSQKPYDARALESSRISQIRRLGQLGCSGTGGTWNRDPV